LEESFKVYKNFGLRDSIEKVFSNKYTILPLPYFGKERLGKIKRERRII